MSRYGCAFLFAVAIGGCTGQPLSAGSNDGGLGAQQTPTTLAKLSSMIDGFAMDDDNLYFTSEDGSLYRLAKTGTSPPTSIAPATAPGSNFTEALAVDDTSLYWTAFGNGVSTGVIFSVPKTGGSPIALAQEQSRPAGIVVDDTSIYWTDQGTPSPASDLNGGEILGAILSMPKAGGVRPTVLHSDPNVPDALTLDATGVIWCAAHAIVRVPKTGGTAVTLATATVAWGSSNLVVAGDTLYWGAEQGDWSLQSVSLGGGSVTTLATPIDAPGGIQALGSSIFWNVANGMSVGAIESVPMAGGAPALTASADFIPASTADQAKFLLADATAFYWVEYWEAPTLTVAIQRLAR
jgi:hypothetical protein